MSQNNALVEIALALAMAFFSIMVVAMVSMSVSDSRSRPLQSVNSDASGGINIRPSSQSRKGPSSPGDIIPIKPEDLVIYYKGKFFDSSLSELDHSRLVGNTIKVLAVNPSISAAEAVRVHGRITSNSLVVTLLNDEWLKILKEKIK